jgi:hypothetical protein
MRRLRPTRNPTKPLVTVIVPCYNYGAFLRDCVRSITSQDDVRTDVLIIDDASTDDSGIVAEALAAEYPEVRVIRHETNHGHIATYNEGLATIRGEYVVLLSADDLLVPGALSRATALMQAQPQVGMVYGNPVEFVGTPPQPLRTEASSWSVWRGPDWIGRQCRRGNSIVYSPEAVVRADVHRAVGGYRADLPHSGDLEMWLRIAAVSDVGRVNGCDQALKRSHGRNMIVTDFPTILADLVERHKAFETFFDAAGHNPRVPPALRAVARRRMAREAVDWAPRRRTSRRTCPSPVRSARTTSCRCRGVSTGGARLGRSPWRRCPVSSRRFTKCAATWQNALGGTGGIGSARERPRVARRLDRSRGLASG